MKTLILVHPGTMVGSARSSLGKDIADAMRHDVFQEVAEHAGNLIVIDGFLSDELSTAENKQITDALTAMESRGYIAIRIWGCDSGMLPHDSWSWSRFPIHMSNRAVIFDSQEEGISLYADLIADHEIVVTGAWASDESDEGCVNSVVDAIKKYKPDANIKISENAIRVPEEYDDEPEEEDEESFTL